MNQSLSNLSANETFQALSVEMHFGVDNRGRATGASNSAAGLSGGNTVTYSVSADSFTLSVSHPPVTFNETFTASNRIDASSSATFTVYAKTGGDVAFVMLKPDDPTLDLSYVTLGNWTSLDSATGNVTNGYLVFGVRTQPGSVPTTGTATYNAQTIGTLVDAAGTIYSVAGFGTLSANFSTGTVNGDFTRMAKVNLLTNAATAWRDFTTTGTIYGNQFSGPAATKDGKLTGGAAGGFYGSDAAEIGGAYLMLGGGERAVGGFVGKK